MAMDKVLKPDRLDVDPQSLTAEKVFKHWKKTFDNFLTQLEAINPGRQPAERVEINKLDILTNFVSAAVYCCIEESTTYTSAVKTLEKALAKSKNKTFA